MGIKKRRGEISEQTIDRRTVLEWLGGGAALSLAGAALIGCDAPPAAGPGDGQMVPDGGAADGAPGDVSAADGPPAKGYPFKPGDHPMYKTWGVRTVDPQDVNKILASWKLKVDGMVSTPRTYTFAELVALGITDMLTDFHCVEGWSVYDVPWNGVHLSKIYAQVKPLSKATHVTFHTVGATYNESLPLTISKEAKTLLGVGVGGSTLPLTHGFPVRVVIPRLLGYKSAKYVERIELTDKPVHGYWVKNGYPYDGDVPKSRLRPGKY